MIFIDFEVFKYDWLCVAVDPGKQKEWVIVNDRDRLDRLYREYKDDLWVNHNMRGYDQYILRAILLGLDPKKVNDWIIVKDRPGWQFSSLFRKIPLMVFDTMPNPPVGLKTLEAFMGSSVKESDVPFDLPRKLTQREIDDTVGYCRNDVMEAIKVFLHRKSQFDAMLFIVKNFDLPLSCIGMTEAQITAKVLGCQKRDWDDEFDYELLPCLRLSKYKHIAEWYEEIRKTKPKGDEAKKAFYKQKLITYVAGVPHTFAFGGLHGATGKIRTKKNGEREIINTPVHRKGRILHVDVGSYYPSMLIAWDLVTRAATNDNYRLVYKTRMQLKREGKKKEQGPYKKMLNALSGAMKDKNNPAYDARNNNSMCINGQLMLLDLVEHLESVPGFELLQSNTDGLIIQIPDTQEAFDHVSAVCREWEGRCSTEKCDILLELDEIDELFQKDVNGYLWIEGDKVHRIGAYVKELSPLDNDLPIVNEALVNYMVHGIPVETTVYRCNDIISFQKVVKLSNKYKWVEHEEKGRTTRYDYKCYRVFASRDETDGRILKCDGIRNPAKFGMTPDRCFILNDSLEAVGIPSKLDKDWYVEVAKKRLADFGVM